MRARVLLALSLGACSASSSPSAMPSAAEGIFQAEVAPILQSSCVACHAGPTATPNFLGPDGKDLGRMYLALDAYGFIKPYGESKLFIKGEHQGGAGRALNQTEQTAGKKWLDAEAQDRGFPVTGVVGQKTFAESFKRFADCMRVTDWTDLKLGEVANQGTQDDGPCRQCHTDGAGGAVYRTDQQGFFMSREVPYLYRIVLGTAEYLPNGYVKLVPANRFELKAIETRQKPAAQQRPHVYNPSPERMKALEQFFNRTNDRYITGVACTPNPPADGGI